jgi:hypothetical protein
MRLLGKSGVESLTVRPILPWNGGSGFGKTSCDAAVRGIAVDATADAAITEVEPSSWRRVIFILPDGEGSLAFLTDLFSLMARRAACSGGACDAQPDPAASAAGFINQDTSSPLDLRNF